VLTYVYILFLECMDFFCFNVGDDGSQSLVLRINGIDVTLQGDKVHEILDTIDACCRESLGRGIFPHGSDAAVETMQLTPHTLLGPATSAATSGGASAASAVAMVTDEGSVQLIDAKKVFRTYLHSYPMLPRPPIAETAEWAKRGVILAPKSQRDVFAKERAEEERLEQEMQRMAAEVQLQRQQRHIEQGRDDMQKYQKKKAKAGGEDGEGDGEEGSDASDNDEAVGAVVGHGGMVLKKKKAHTSRSVFGATETSEDIRLQMLQERVSAVVCGVSSKPTSRFKQFAIPVAPTRVAGTIKLVTSYDKKRSVRRPVVLESRGLAELLELPPVTLTLGGTSGGAGGTDLTAGLEAYFESQPLLLQQQQLQRARAASPSGSGMRSGSATGDVDGGGGVGGGKSTKKDRSKSSKKGSVAGESVAMAADGLEAGSPSTSQVLAWDAERVQSSILEHSVVNTMLFNERLELQAEWCEQSRDLLYNHNTSNLQYESRQLQSKPLRHAAQAQTQKQTHAPKVGFASSDSDESDAPQSHNNKNKKGPVDEETEGEEEQAPVVVSRAPPKDPYLHGLGFYLKKKRQAAGRSDAGADYMR
jgi:hypothetical protein